MSDWLTSPSDAVYSPEEVLSLAIREHSPVRVFACFSSGNDSVVSTHIAMQNGAHEVFNIDTTIGIAQSRQHFYEVCERFRWPFRVKFPPDLDYDAMVMKYGFPGPGAHAYPYSWLKERAIRQLVRETKHDDNDRVMLVTGVRRSESTHRMGYVEPIIRLGCTVWVAPIYAWSVKERDAYMEKHSLPRNPVSDLIHISGECCCGAYARPGERKEIAFWFPKTEARIARLETQAKEAGQPYHEWSTGKYHDPQQSELFMPMCAGCLNGQSAGVAREE